MTKDEALKLGLQLVETAEYLATDSAICGNYVKEERALIQQSKIAFEEALAQSDQESDDLTVAYTSGFFEGKKNRKWIGLTDEEAAECWNSSAVTTWKNIEAKLREKNGC